MGLADIFGKSVSQKSTENMLSIMIRRYNDLVHRINEKGGEQFLNEAVIISDVQLDRLIRLCHPDKHDNSDAATKATQWLLSIKDKR